LAACLAIAADPERLYKLQDVHEKQTADCQSQLWKSEQRVDLAEALEAPRPI
jgi:hypothetical protein